MDTTNDNMLVASFFAIVNSEILVWDSVDDALRSAGGITLGRFIPLLYLAKGPMRLQDLARQCHTKKSATSRLVERMCSDGLVRKDPDHNDQRGVVLSITDKGREVEALARAAFVERLSSLLGTQPPEQLASCRELYDRLSEHTESEHD